MMINIEDYNQEFSDIESSKKNKKLFLGQVQGSLNIIFNENTPKNFYPLHLNRSLEGIFTKTHKEGFKEYKSSCSNTSIYKLFSELEYIRMYSKFKQLKNEIIIIYIYSFSNEITPNNISVEDYLLQHQTEVTDINRSYQLPRVFSGTIYANYSVRYKNREDIVEKKGEYSSVYSLITDLEELRNRAAIENHLIQDITIELTKLDDSKVWYREKVMKLKDERAKKEI